MCLKSKSIRLAETSRSSRGVDKLLHTKFICENLLLQVRIMLLGFRGGLFLCLLAFYPAQVSAGVDSSLNACSSNPCLNSGICTYMSNGFVCTCVNGFIGLRCERRSDECTLTDSIRCDNGHCRLDARGIPRCECNAHYGGRYCDKKLNTCEYVSCNGGSCSNTNDGHVCKCPTGFKGKNCQINSQNTTKCLKSCNDTIPGSGGGKCWHERSQVIKVGWGYKQSCSTRQSCFDMASGSVDYVDVQLKPVQAQPNDTLVFLTDIDALLYNNSFIPHVIPVETSSSDSFSNCNMSHAVPIANFSTGGIGEIIVNASYLHAGMQYFIANVNALHRCEFGLRLNVTVKENKCRNPSQPGAEMCHGHGKCYTDFTKSSFECTCCEGFVGKFCDTEDPCLVNPCKNNGKCNIVTDGNGQKTFRCKCQIGFSGFDCNQTIDHCESSPCLNGAACVSSNAGFSCICKNGFSGSSCQMNDNQCASNPCRNGATCTDGDNSFTCDCINGFKGICLSVPFISLYARRKKLKLWLP